MSRSRDAADQRWVLDLAATAGALTEDDDLWFTLLDLLAARLRSEFSCFADHALEVPRVAVGDYVLTEDVEQHLLSLVHLHPLWAPVLGASSQAPAAPARISDVVTAAAWRENPINREVLAPHGLAQHTICVVVSAGAASEVAWYAFNRDRDFDEWEVALLTQVQPLLALLRHRADPRATQVGAGLTRREMEVLHRLAQGLTAAATARRLGISKRTVDKHLEHVHAKLGTSGPVATVDAARRCGLLHERH